MKRKRRRTTAVPDRTGSRWPLGDEAKMIAAMLRTYGADATRAAVPGVTTDEERSLWLKSRSGRARAPSWVIDYAAAILEQIPERKDKPDHRPRDPLQDRIELLAPAMGGLTKAARFVVMAEVYAAGQKPAPPLHETEAEIEAWEDEVTGREAEIEARVAKLLNAIYRRRKPD